MSIEDLAKIATTTIACENRRLKVCLDIPLVDKTDYTVYQLHPVPVIQSILRNGSGRAYVCSTFSHIAMEESRRTYILMNQEERANVRTWEVSTSVQENRLYTKHQRAKHARARF